MTRLLEVIVATIIVIALAVLVGVLLPSSGHIERSIELSHNIDHVEDVLNNFRNFPEYSELADSWPGLDYQLGGESFGEGARISWQGNKADAPSGSLEVVSSEPGKIVWALDNDWRGKDKAYTITLERTDNAQLVKMTWAYDVDYGWSLMDRYSQLYLHGKPASFMQYSMKNLQNMLANIPNILYDDLAPRLVDTPAQPVLTVSTKAPRSLDQIKLATDAALAQIHAAMAELGVEATGPVIAFTTDWGQTEYRFDVAVPINASSLTIDGTSYPLLDEAGASKLKAERKAAESEDESAAPEPPKPGDYTSDGLLRVTDDVRGKIAFGGRALAAEWQGSYRLEAVRLALKAFAGTHGYTYNEFVHRLYDITTDLGSDAVNDQTWIVYLPVDDAPKFTPNQDEAKQWYFPPAPGSAPAPATASSVAPAAAATVAE